MLLCIPGICSATTISGDWSYLVDVTTSAENEIDVETTLAGQSVASLSGNISEGGTESNTFDISVNLVSTDILTEVTIETSPGGYGSGYLTVPNEALNAIRMSGRVDWTYGSGSVSADVHVTSYDLEDNPNTGFDGSGTYYPQTIPPIGGTMPIFGYFVLVLVLFFLILYTFSDLDNRLYATVALSLLAALLAYMLAIMSVNGSVADVSPILINQTALNNTTTFEYASVATEFHSGALAWFFALIGIFMTIISIYLAVEAFWDNKRQIDGGDIDDY